MTIYLKFIIPILALLVITQTSFAAAHTEQPQVVPYYDQSNYNQEIQQLFQSSLSHTSDIKTKLTSASAYFLGRPYLLGAAGEGPYGRYDQNPLYRTDAFDCMTYVNTVLALAESDNLAQFQYHLKHINYLNGQPSFTSRNHFMESDWNLNNARKGYVRDITLSIVDSRGNSVAITRRILIDKPNWFRSLKASQLKFLQPLAPIALQQRLNELQNKSTDFSPQQSQLTYVPMTRLFDGRKRPVTYLFNQIPSGAIIEIVNPKPELKAKIGTPMYISHVGLAIRTPQGLMFREASSYLHKVVDIPLAQYPLLMHLNINDKTGINIQEILKTS